MANFMRNTPVFIPFHNEENMISVNDRVPLPNSAPFGIAENDQHSYSKRRRRDARDEDASETDECRPPWQRHRYSPSVVGLHEEIEDSYTYLSLGEEEKEIRLRVVGHIERIVKSMWPQAKVNVFGSMKTQLCLPTSDIDVVITGKWESLPLETIRKALIADGIVDKDIILIKTAVVPIIRMVHTPTRVKVDISFNVPNGIKSAELILEHSKVYPALPKLVLLLKQYLHQRKLNEVYNGGLSSYSLTLLVLSLLQSPHKPKSFLTTNLGTLLMEFLELYGINFNYYKVTISVANDGSYCPKSDDSGMLLSIQDPHAAENNVAKGSYMIHVIKQSFENAYNTLHKRLTEQKDIGNSLLKNIVEIDQSVLIQREWLVSNFQRIIRSFRTTYNFDIQKYRLKVFSDPTRPHVHVEDKDSEEENVPSFHRNKMHHPQKTLVFYGTDKGAKYLPPTGRIPAHQNRARNLHQDTNEHKPYKHTKRNWTYTN